MDEIYKRRSYHGGYDATKTISDDDIKSVVKAGMNAPSALNKQPWEFVVIDDRELLNKLSTLTPGTSSTASASHAIFVCGETDKYGYAPIDAGISTENIVLQATHLGIGSLIMGIYPNEPVQTAIRELIGLPDDYNAYTLISLGYPTETIEPNDRYIESKFHYNKF